MPTTTIKTINQLANSIILGETKLSDVPEFRRKSVSNLMRIAKPESIRAMATRDDDRASGVQAKAASSKKEPSRFFPVRGGNVRSW